MQSGRLRGIAVGSERRLAEFPDLPAAAETLPDFRTAGWLALMAPLGTPENIVSKVSSDLAKLLARPELRTKLAALGSYTRGFAPADTQKYIQTEQQTWGPILEDLARSQ